MRHIHLDAVGGIAGDMFVAAMLDLLPEHTGRVMADLASALPAGAGQVGNQLVKCNDLTARHFSFSPAVLALRTPSPDTSFAALSRRISPSAMSAGTADAAIAILTILAESEALIHGVPLPEVHFHELADWDSLADVVAAGSLIAALPATTWSVSALPLGSGLVKTAHGLLPVPAPATTAILTGFDWHDDGVAGERVTPTGAAILKFLVKPGAKRPPGRLVSSGTGAGTRRFSSLPNILRATLFDIEGASGGDRIAVISFEVDDMTGEEIGTACARLRAVPGVVDLSNATRRGKKERPLEEFRLLVAPAAVEAVAQRCFAETSTIGLRLDEHERLLLPRSQQAGQYRTKSVVRPGNQTTIKVENDDLTGDSLAERRRQKQLAEGQ